MYAIEWLIFYHLKDNGNKNCYPHLKHGRIFIFFKEGVENF
jgi:hypothetical protein